MLRKHLTCDRVKDAGLIATTSRCPYNPFVGIFHPQSTHDRKRCHVLGLGATLNRIQAQSVECSSKGRVRGFGHVTVAMIGIAQPIAEVTSLGIRLNAGHPNPAHDRSIGSTCDQEMERLAVRDCRSRFKNSGRDECFGYGLWPRSKPAANARGHQLGDHHRVARTNTAKMDAIRIDSVEQIIVVHDVIIVAEAASPPNDRVSAAATSLSRRTPTAANDGMDSSCRAASWCQR